MKKRQLRLATILLSAMFLMTGCGTPLFEMTDEERDIIVHYAAYVVGKHNIYQKDGMTNANPEDWLEEDEPVVEEEQPPVAENDEESMNVSSGGQAQSEEIPQASISLVEALGQKSKVSVTYHGSATSDTYQEGNYYSVSTVFGKTFLVMNFTIKNTTSKDVKIDAFSQNPVYAVSIDGQEPIQEKQTFLTYSLSTFQGSLKSGEKVDVVLLFEVPKEQVDNMKKVSLMMRQKGDNYLVEL